MKQILCILIISTVFSSVLCAQNAEMPTENPSYDKRMVEVKNSFWKGLYVVQNEESYTFKQAQKQIMYDVLEAYEEMRRARQNMAFSNISGAIGGFFVGWSLADILLPGQEPSYVMIGAGLGLVITSGIFGDWAFKRAKNAAEMYNESLSPPSTTTAQHFDVKFRFSGTSAGLTVQF